MAMVVFCDKLNCRCFLPKRRRLEDPPHEEDGMPIRTHWHGFCDDLNCGCSLRKATGMDSATGDRLEDPPHDEIFGQPPSEDSMDQLGANRNSFVPWTSTGPRKDHPKLRCGCGQECDRVVYEKAGPANPGLLMKSSYHKEGGRSGCTGFVIDVHGEHWCTRDRSKNPSAICSCLPAHLLAAAGVGHLRLTCRGTLMA